VWRGPSDSWGYGYNDDELFGVVVGVSGNMTWGQQCLTIGATSFAFNVGGRISFSVGALGSVQSDADDYLRLTYGAPYATGGAESAAMLVTQPITAGTTEGTALGVRDGIFGEITRGHAGFDLNENE
jgi:hypothetical protein